VFTCLDHRSRTSSLVASRPPPRALPRALLFSRKVHSYTFLLDKANKYIAKKTWSAGAGGSRLFDGFDERTKASRRRRRARQPSRESSSRALDRDRDRTDRQHRKIDRSKNGSDTECSVCDRRSCLLTYPLIDEKLVSSYPKEHHAIVAR